MVFGVDLENKMEKQKSSKYIIKLLEKGIDLGKLKYKSRDELHDRNHTFKEKL